MIKTLSANLSEKELKKELKMKGLEVEKTEGTVLHFKKELMIQQQEGKIFKNGTAFCTG
jgi:hypothetical protein